MLGTLETHPATDRADLLAPPVATALTEWPAAPQIYVAEIEPTAADTAKFCLRYGVPLDASANCVVVSGKRAGEERVAACMVLATTRADVNNVARRLLDVRKASFLRMADAVARTGMEYGGITPVGLPADWLVLIDRRVADSEHVVIGSGVRRSKLVLPGAALATLPAAQVIDGLATPASGSAAG